MKTNVFTRGRDGAVLLTTVCILSVLTLMAVSYLFLLKDNNYFVARDQSWNRALVLAEAGVEEAMAHINRGGLATAPQPYSGDGWNVSGTNYSLPATRTNLYGGIYSVLLYGSTSNATITSTGTVTAPLSGTELSRVIQVTAPFTSAFQVGIASITTVTLTGGSKLTIDSYDSSDTNLFPGGLYNVTNREDRGDIAVLTNSGGAFSLGNASIMGIVHTAPGGTMGQVNIGPQGGVGTVPYVTGGGNGFESSAFFADDFNLTFPDVNVPYTSATVLANTISSSNVISSGQYIINGTLNIKNGGTLSVGAYQYVTIYVTGGVTMNNGGALINIQPGGTLIMYVGGASASFSQINNGGNANNFQYYGLPGNTSITMGGQSAYIGTIYAPEAAIKMNGGGSTPLDYQGAMVVQQLTSSGHFSMHYDENLAREPIAGTFIPNSWQELASSRSQ